MKVNDKETVFDVQHDRYISKITIPSNKYASVNICKVKKPGRSLCKTILTLSIRTWSFHVDELRPLSKFLSDIADFIEGHNE